MTKEQEIEITDQIKTQMTKVRNDAIVIGMKSVLSVVLDICKKENTPEEKLLEIMDFCNRGLHNNNDNDRRDNE